MVFDLRWSSIVAAAELDSLRVGGFCPAPWKQRTHHCQLVPPGSALRGGLSSVSGSPAGSAFRSLLASSGKRRGGPLGKRPAAPAGGTRQCLAADAAEPRFWASTNVEATPQPGGPRRALRSVWNRRRPAQAGPGASAPAPGGALGSAEGTSHTRGLCEPASARRTDSKGDRENTALHRIGTHHTTHTHTIPARSLGGGRPPGRAAPLYPPGTEGRPRTPASTFQRRPARGLPGAG